MGPLVIWGCRDICCKFDLAVSGRWVCCDWRPKLPKSALFPLPWECRAMCPPKSEAGRKPPGARLTDGLRSCPVKDSEQQTEWFAPENQNQIIHTCRIFPQQPKRCAEKVCGSRLPRRLRFHPSSLLNDQDFLRHALKSMKSPWWAVGTSLNWAVMPMFRFLIWKIVLITFLFISSSMDSTCSLTIADMSRVHPVHFPSRSLLSPSCPREEGWKLNAALK